MTEGNGGERDALAPVIPLFGSAAPEHEAESEWHATWLDDRAPADAREPASRDDADDRAERMLLRKLRTRSLSVREALTALRDADVDPGEAEALVARFQAQGYLDDRALAFQLIDRALSRKAQGRQAIAQVLSQRGIDRAVADAALADLPDDETERALEFARTKVQQMQDLDRDTAVRRLAGQLARRGFGSMALSAARTAWDEVDGRSQT
jgi:regulatory protein